MQVSDSLPLNQLMPPSSSYHMLENTIPSIRDRRGLGKFRMAQLRYAVDNTKISLWILGFIALAFTYDHTVSAIMYAVDYDRNTISNIWFLRNQYAYLIDVKHVVGLTPDPFHVFELFVWLMIPLNLAKIVRGIFFLGYVDEVRSPWNKNLSGGPYVLGLFLFSSVGLLTIVFAKDFANAFPLVLAYFPKAAIGLETWVFCIGSLLLADAVVAFIQLNLGSSRRNKG